MITLSNMKKTILCLMTAAALIGCRNDDTDFSAYTNGEVSTSNVIYISYSGTSVSVTGDTNGYVTTDGADVTVNTGTDTDSLLLVLSGSTTDGSLLVYREKKYGIMLNGVTIHNADGPAINNQCGKSLYVEVVGTNTLTDGTAYTDVTDNDGNTIQQKGAFFSEGQVYFTGSGSLSVTGSTYHAIAVDDYIVIDGAAITASSPTGNGIKVNDGFWMQSGTLDISVTGDACRGIKSDSVVVISGGDITIDTQGGCVYDETEADYSSAACIKCDYDFTMTAGTLTMTSSGDGGKGLNCATNVVMSGGTLSAVTTGSNNDAKPKAVKGDTGITLSGGSFYAKVDKSWACDNGTDSEEPSERVTIVGTPSEESYAKKEVKVVF